MYAVYDITVTEIDYTDLIFDNSPVRNEQVELYASLKTGPINSAESSCTIRRGANFIYRIVNHLILNSIKRWYTSTA